MGSIEITLIPLHSLCLAFVTCDMFSHILNESTLL